MKTIINHTNTIEQKQDQRLRGENMNTIEQRKLGTSGLMVPAMGVGVWSWGDTRWWNYGQSHAKPDIVQAYRTSLDAGFTFFDTTRKCWSARLALNPRRTCSNESDGSCHTIKET